jgi:hypothetical protein
MKRLLGQFVKYLLAFALVLYVGDWVVFEVAVHRQAAIGSVQVERFLGTRLKGEKEEYDYLGTQDVSCARAIFPRASNPPCWWVERHREQWTQ